MAATIRWLVDPETAWNDRYEGWANKRVPDIVWEVLDARTAEITQWLKENHPFRNRTGNAERSLHAEVFREEMAVTLYMAYTIPIFYSVYLESSRWGVLGIAMDYWMPILLKDLKVAFKG